MAAPPTDSDDASLDFCSEEFDPLKALKATESQVILPFPDIAPFYSLTHYKEILKKQPTHTNPKKIGQGGEQPLVTSGTTEEDKPSKTRPIKSILTFMPGTYEIACMNEYHH